jgi:hypothetical protein
MRMKKIIRTKTFWTGIGTIALGVYQIVNGDVGNGIQSVSLGAGLIFIRDSIAGL